MRYLQTLRAGLTAAIIASLGAPALAQESNDGPDYAQRLSELLRVQGYSQVNFLDLQGSLFTAEACEDARLYRLTFNRNGRVQEKAEIGECGPPAPERQITNDVVIDALYGRGYLRINIVDQEPPTLLVNACRGDRKFEIRLDAEGDIIDEKEEGACDLSQGDPLTADQVSRILSLQGYRAVNLTTTAEPPYRATACNGVRQFDLRITSAGQVEMRETNGFCDVGRSDVEYLPPRPIDRESIQQTDALQPERCQMILDWLQYETPLTFAKGSAELNEKDRALIATIADTLQRCPSTRTLVEGHTSQTGGDALNQDLSEERALAVENALREAGVSTDRLQARGFGESYPRIAGDADANLNRRIEIQLEWTS